jgi:hypothetical protein
MALRPHLITKNENGYKAHFKEKIMLNSKTLGVTLAATVLVSLLPAFADDVSSSTSVSADGMGTAVKSSTTSVNGGCPSNRC